VEPVIDLLLFKSWWAYRPAHSSWYDVTYHVFNLFEGLVWVILAGLVLRRYRRSRRSTVEVWYAASFLTFGLTDFREAYALESWLLWLKAANLLALIRLRSIVIKRYYPDSKLY
jgi:hypothetical protein